MIPRPPAPRLLLALLAAVGCQRADGVDGTVIILVMDGVRLQDSLGDEPSSATGEPPAELMPVTWSRLLPQGARASQAWNLGATTTTPAHAALISGRRQPLATVSADDEVGLYRPQLPSLFEAVREQLGDGEEQVVLVANTGLVRPVERSLWPGALGAGWVWVGDEDGSPSPDDRRVLARLQERLDEFPTRLALVNMHQLDRSGHYGDNDDYLDDLRSIDAPIAELWDWLEGHHHYQGDTTLMIVADHGRHSLSDDDPHWRHHGDSCNGCRRIQALALGPEVVAGVDLDDPFLITDVAPTAAGILGVDLPWADGLVQRGLLTRPSVAASRSGLADLALAGGLVAELRYQDDPWHRSALWVGGTRLSSAEALLVEAPAMARDGELAWVCFRELALAPYEDSTTWVARCAQSVDSGASWEAIAAPVEQVGPLWRPVLRAGGAGTVVAAWVDNRAGTADGGAVGTEGDLHLVVSQFDGSWSSGWMAADLSYPLDMAAALEGDLLITAVGAGPLGSGSQHARDIWVGSVALGGAQPRWQSLAASGLGDLLGVTGSWRMELPALRVDEAGTLHLAAVAHSDAGGHGVLASSDDQGRSWSRAAMVDLPFPPDPHLAPVWLGERAVWVVVDVPADESRLCAASLDLAPSCVQTGSPRVLRTAVEQQLYVLVDQGVGAWSLESFEI